MTDPRDPTRDAPISGQPSSGQPISGQPNTGAPDANRSNLYGTNLPAIIAALYLAAFLLIFTPIVGVVLAYVWRNEGGRDWEQSHFTYLIRTFWIGFSLCFVFPLLAFALMFLAAIGPAGEAAFLGISLITIGLFLGAAILLAVRSIVSLVRALQHKPMENPQSWLV